MNSKRTTINQCKHLPTTIDAILAETKFAMFIDQLNDGVVWFKAKLADVAFQYRQM